MSSHLYLYKITNKLNDKVYIGVTKNLKSRWNSHRSSKSSCTKLRNAMCFYGRDNFEITPLCLGPREYILELEVSLIRAYNSVESGYNLIIGDPGNGGAELGDEQKAKISAGLVEFYKHNTAWNSGGITLQPKKPDPIYMSGFWFPNQRTGLASLGINIKTFYRRNMQGTLGDTIHYRKDSRRPLNPIYVGGIWFPCIKCSSVALGISTAGIYKRLRDGFIEEISEHVVRGKFGTANHMNGRIGDLHHRSRAIVVDGVKYGSIREAARLTNYTLKMLHKELKRDVDNIYYFSEEIYGDRPNNTTRDNIP